MMITADCSERSDTMFTYYLLLRPVGIGCQPKGFVSYENYERRKYVPEIDHEAWGTVSYDRELSQKEINDYDLMKGE